MNACAHSSAPFVRLLLEAGKRCGAPTPQGYGATPPPPPPPPGGRTHTRSCTEMPAHSDT
eukprot:5585851-Prymnesium_polylepis.1